MALQHKKGSETIRSRPGKRGCNMIVTFFGHAQILQREEIEKWLYVVTENLIEQGAITFYLGGYGAFDSLAASVLKAQKKGILTLNWFLS